MGEALIYTGEKKTYHNSFGFERKPKEAIYKIGSISKTYTAALVMKLLEDKKLSLDSKLSEFYPQIENSEKITVKQLLGHRSGIKSMTSDPDFQAFSKRPNTQKELLERITSYSSEFEPDSKFAYSNSGYIVLSLIAEKASGLSLHKLLTEFI